MWNVDLSPILASVCLEYIVESEIGHGSNQNGDIDRKMHGKMVRSLVYYRWGNGSKPVTVETFFWNGGRIEIR